jgi:hypothetical protein
MDKLRWSERHCGPLRSGVSNQRRERGKEFAGLTSPSTFLTKTLLCDSLFRYHSCHIKLRTSRMHYCRILNPLNFSLASCG